VQSDDGGHFAVDNLDPGRYALVVVKAGFALETIVVAGQRVPNKEIIVTAGRRIVAELRIGHGGTLMGVVVDEFTEPCPGVFVTPLKAQNTSGQTRLAAAGRSVATNEVGEFRIGGLRSAHYYISVTPPPDTETFSPASAVKYVKTYFPGVEDA